jgi:hypothetical protein
MNTLDRKSSRTPAVWIVSVASMLAGVGLLGIGCTVTTTNTTTDDPNVASSAAASSSVVSASAEPAASTVKFPTIPTNNGSPGDWNKPNPNGKANGEGCAKPDDCKSGVCEGEGCGAGPKCVDPNRACTRDLTTYCGCDGQVFSSSGSCAGRPFKKRGSCD